MENQREPERLGSVDDLSKAFADFELPDGWHIECNPKPIPDRRFDWDYWHDEVDEENGLCGSAMNPECCLIEIQEKVDP